LPTHYRESHSIFMKKFVKDSKLRFSKCALNNGANDRLFDGLTKEGTYLKLAISIFHKRTYLNKFIIITTISNKTFDNHMLLEHQ